VNTTRVQTRKLLDECIRSPSAAIR
jgi:hypothetical protein